MNLICSIWLAVAGVSLAAGLEFTALINEVNAPADVKSVVSDFTFANRSDNPVTIAKYNPTCSCMSVQVQDGKRRYAPGESGVIRTEFDMGNFTGTVDKTVAVWLDNDPANQPSVILTVRVHIPVLVQLEPKTLKWQLNGPGTPQSIAITMRHEKPIHVSKVTSSSPAFKSELRTIEDGKSYQLIVTPVDVKTPSLGILRIETDCTLEKHRIQQAFATVTRSASATPKPTAP